MSVSPVAMERATRNLVAVHRAVCGVSVRLVRVERIGGVRKRRAGMHPSPCPTHVISTTDWSQSISIS